MVFQDLVEQMRVEALNFPKDAGFVRRRGLVYKLAWRLVKEAMAEGLELTEKEFGHLLHIGFTAHKERVAEAEGFAGINEKEK